MCLGASCSRSASCLTAPIISPYNFSAIFLFQLHIYLKFSLSRVSNDLFREAKCPPMFSPYPMLYQIQCQFLHLQYYKIFHIIICLMMVIIYPGRLVGFVYLLICDYSYNLSCPPSRIIFTTYILSVISVIFFSCSCDTPGPFSVTGPFAGGVRTFFSP